jgi:hypothetical protein
MAISILDLGTEDAVARLVCGADIAETCRSAIPVFEEMVNAAFTRLASIPGGGAHLPQPWLPAAARVTEHLPHSEVDEFVQDVFGTWIKKLRAAIPAELPLRA